MTLDVATRRNLELTETLRHGAVQGSLLGVLDATVTSMGGRLLRRWLNQPLLDLDRLSQRLDTVEAFYYNDTPARTRVRAMLKRMSLTWSVWRAVWYRALPGPETCWASAIAWRRCARAPGLGGPDGFRG